MRISDWSSDVCSSDLAPLALDTLDLKSLSETKATVLYVVRATSPTLSLLRPKMRMVLNERTDLQVQLLSEYCILNVVLPHLSLSLFVARHNADPPVKAFVLNLGTKIGRASVRERV